MPTTAGNPESLSAREIVSTRLFEHSRIRLFDAFCDPLKLAQWWGPKDFKNTFSEFEFRVGGHWRFVMHGPNGVDHPNENLFIEIIQPEKIVFEHVSPPNFKMTMTFEDLDLKTKLTWRMLFESAAICANLKGIIPECNEQNFDRLEKVLSRSV